MEIDLVFNAKGGGRWDEEKPVENKPVENKPVESGGGGLFNQFVH